MHFSFKFNFVSLPDESSRMLLKRRTLFFGLTDADKRETEIVNCNVMSSHYSFHADITINEGLIVRHECAKMEP